MSPSPQRRLLKSVYLKNFMEAKRCSVGRTSAWSGRANRLRLTRGRSFEASVLYDDHMGEWQAAVHLLTGCEPVSGALGQS
jgi:hypothetical protein